MSVRLRPSEPPGAVFLSYQLPVWVWPTALMGVCIVAVIRGRDMERLAAGADLATWALSLVVFKARSSDMQWAVLPIDLALLATLTWIALVSRRFWPLFAAAFQLLAVLMHIGHSLDQAISGWAYLTALLLWNYLTLFAIGYGSWTAPRRYAEIEALDASEVPGATRR